MKTRYVKCLIVIDYVTHAIHDMLGTLVGSIVL